MEETPEDEVVDDTEESAKRDIIFGVKDVPPPDFAIDDDAIAASAHAIDLSNLEHRNIPRPQNVGILGIEVYFPKRVSIPLKHSPLNSNLHQVHL